MHSFKHTWICLYSCNLPYPENSPLFCLLMDVSTLLSTLKLKFHVFLEIFSNQFSPWWSGLCYPTSCAPPTTWLQSSCGMMGWESGSSLPVWFWWCIKFSPSSPVCLLLFAFQHSQIMAQEFSPWALYLHFSGRDGAVCLFYLTWNVSRHSTLI